MSRLEENAQIPGLRHRLQFPPIALPAVLGLACPSHLHDDSLVQAGLGNKIYVEGGTTLVLHIEDHKNSRKAGGHLVHCKLPLDLEVILRLHLVWGQQFLGSHLPSRPPSLFLKAAGGQLTESHLCNQWRHMMESVGCPALFGPRYCRHIFVNSRRNHPGMAAHKSRELPLPWAAVSGCGIGPMTSFWYPRKHRPH